MYRADQIKRYPKWQHKGESPTILLVLLDTALRTEHGWSQHRNVSEFAEGLVYLTVQSLSGEGAYLWPTVEVSPDTNSWANRQRGEPIDRPGYYVIPLTLFGTYLRLAYRVQGYVKFGAAFEGKRLWLSPGGETPERNGTGLMKGVDG